MPPAVVSVCTAPLPKQSATTVGPICTKMHVLVGSDEYADRRATPEQRQLIGIEEFVVVVGHGSSEHQYCGLLIRHSVSLMAVADHLGPATVPQRDRSLDFRR
jgi:hypothetical protein